MAYHRLTLQDADARYPFCGYPNGTVLDRAQNIRYSGLPTNQMIFWLEDHLATPEEFEAIYATAGVISFTRIEPQPAISIHDPAFVFQDEFLQTLFA